MSTIVKYSSGSTYTIVPNKVEVEKVQDLDGQYHIPNTSIVGMMRLGLGVQRITVSGDILDMSACLWHDVVAISFDSGTSYQTVYFAGVPYTSDCWSGIYPYALSLLASPLKEQTAVRYPTTGYKWGNQSITGISQAGNVNAYPIIHYLAPLFYAPLSNTLVDFAGQSVTFTRTAAKSHGGVTYPINTPIFDAGLYLASETAQDVATWTPPASTLRTVCMQIKSRYPSPWSIGGGGANLLTANQSNVETDTTGFYAGGGTLTRTGAAGEFYAGSAGLKLVSTGAGDIDIMVARPSVTAGLWYNFNVYAKSTNTSRFWHLAITFCDSGNNPLSTITTTNAYSPADFTRLSLFGQAPANATNAQLYVYLVGTTTGEILYADNFMLEAIPQYLYVWDTTYNRLIIDTVGNALWWNDGTTTVSATFPTAYYLSGGLVNIAVIDDTGHAVTVAVTDSVTWYIATGTLAALSWSFLVLGNLEGSISNLIEYGYVLTLAEYSTIDFSSLSLAFYGSHVSGITDNLLYIGNRYAGEIIKGSDGRLVNANGSDISALLGGADITIGPSTIIAQVQGLSARWYVEVKRTDV